MSYLRFRLFLLFPKTNSPAFPENSPGSGGGSGPNGGEPGPARPFPGFSGPVLQPAPTLGPGWATAVGPGKYSKGGEGRTDGESQGSHAEQFTGDGGPGGGDGPGQGRNGGTGIVMIRYPA